MKHPIVNQDDPNLEEAEYLSIFEYLWYKGKPFTGTLLEGDGKSYTEYEDGAAHGRCIEYYENGQLSTDWIFEKGSTISEKSWYPNGQLQKDNLHWYNEDGKLIRLNGSWLYLNGQKISEQNSNESYYFSPQGEMAIKVIRKTNTDDKDTHVYYDSILSECFLQLFFNYYPQIHEYNPVSDSLIWGWVMKKYSIDKDNGLDIFYKLAKYNNSRIADTANYLLKKLHEKAFAPEEYIDNLHIDIKLKE